MSDVQAAWLLIGAGAALTVFIIAFVARKSSALYEWMLRLTTSFGWEAPRRIWWPGTIRGRWQGIHVDLSHMNRYKGNPERLVLTVKTAAPARIIIKRRGGFMSKPLTLFGPPIVEPANPAVREQFWVRSNEALRRSWSGT
jgi:hypothetical protein